MIQNDGEIEANSFELIGASTKRDEEEKIGFFGSGLKYSIAYMMRNSVKFHVFAGERQMVFTLQAETLKSMQFDRICIDGRPTSYTTTMGPTWTEDWFVLREIYCNAVDEGGCIMIKCTENVSPVEGKTRIYIELTDSLKVIIEEWNSYFSDEREPIFDSPPVYTSSLGTADGKGYINQQGITGYHKTKGVLFRRGIRVYNHEYLLYDYECKYININEDRSAKNMHGFGYGITGLMTMFVNENWIKSILRTSGDDRPCEEYSYLGCGDSNDTVSDEWIRFSKENLLVVKDISGKYAQDIVDDKREAFYLPRTLAYYIKKYQPDVTIVGLGKSTGKEYVTAAIVTPKMNYLVKDVLKSLKEMGYDVPYPIEIVEFESDNILGQANTKDKIIFLSSKIFDTGRREIAHIIIHETEHINSGHEDETRRYEKHLIDKYLTYMENALGLFL